MNIQDWFPLGWTGWISLQSKGLSRVFSNTTVQKHQFFSAQLSLWSNTHIHTWLLTKAIALTKRTFVGKVMSLLFNMLSRLVIAFFPRSKHLLISWLQSPSTMILEPKKIKSVTVSVFFPLLFAMKWRTRYHNLSFFECWVLSQLFHSPFLLLSRGSTVPLCFLPLRVVSSAYLRLLIFLPAILIPAYKSCSQAFCMMYSACKLNKQGDNMQHWCTPFCSFEPVHCSMSSSTCCFLSYTHFSGGRSGGLVFPSLSEFSTVYCDPYSQRLWHSQ